MMRAAGAWVLAGVGALVFSGCSLLIDTGPLTRGFAGSPGEGGGESGAGAPGSTVGGGALGGATSGASCVAAATDFFCDGLDQNCQPTLQEPVCPAGCTGATHSGASYMACAVSATFMQAELLCQQQGMHLVKVDSESENTFVVQLAQSLGSYVWLGGSDLEQNSTFAWVGGVAFFSDGAAVPGVYQNFAAGEPSADAARHCVHLHDDPPGYWLVTRCTESKQFICERY